MSQERIDELEERIAQLEKQLTSAMEWVAVLGKQDVDLLQVMTWNISKVSGGRISPPPDFTDETFMDVARHIVGNAVTLNDFLLKVEAERNKDAGEPE